MSRLVEKVHDAVSRAKTEVHDIRSKTKDFAQKNDIPTQYVDLTIQFIGASGIPKMDVVGTADPYFIAHLDNNIKYVSTVQRGTQKPVWNATWYVKNVPTTASLHVQVLDKDDGQVTDDNIGKFTTSVSPGAKEVEIEGPIFKRTNGTFWLKIESKKPDADLERCPPYTFDGPIHFTRHFSPTVGRLTNINDERLYSTWKIYVKGVHMFFGDTVQPWNRNYKAAQSIFGSGPSALAVRSGIQAGHRLLYARSTRNGFGTITQPSDIMALLCGGKQAMGSRAPVPHRVKPAVYTYIISRDDESLRFSETGAAFFVDFASKHALHAACAETVRYSGEFHPRPRGGWAAFSEDTPDDATAWELVIDNNSGTYSPDKGVLPQLKELLEYNFPGFSIYALDHEDPELKSSREACREYALKFRGVKQEELQPHSQEGVETLSYHASSHRNDSMSSEASIDAPAEEGGLPPPQ
ncbi:C2-domain-containing protein [Auriscalpium vulgare]|uniref:C2-domain-containing protein n=1 Tax=Auriscalpium vulgare TaxID=40419 RepID=A0ACB8RRU5_9AGAM|nr:C2-domain-containing protein [Auriscalpium vulgare]